MLTKFDREEFEAADAAVFNLLQDKPHLKETVGKVPTGHLRQIIDVALKGAAQYRAENPTP